MKKILRNGLCSLVVLPSLYFPAFAGDYDGGTCLVNSVTIQFDFSTLKVADDTNSSALRDLIAYSPHFQQVFSGDVGGRVSLPYGPYAGALEFVYGDTVIGKATNGYFYIPEVNDEYITLQVRFASDAIGKLVTVRTAAGQTLDQPRYLLLYPDQNSKAKEIYFSRIQQNGENLMFPSLSTARDMSRDLSNLAQEVFTKEGAGLVGAILTHDNRDTYVVNSDTSKGAFLYGAVLPYIVSPGNDLSSIVSSNGATYNAGDLFLLPIFAQRCAETTISSTSEITSCDDAPNKSMPMCELSISDGSVTYTNGCCSGYHLSTDE